MDATARYQRQLLDRAQYTYHRTPISAATAEAFMATPRHLFVKRYRERAGKVWIEVNEASRGEHLAMLYADEPLILFGDDDDNVASTISQPSFVLRMLDLLQLEQGQTVLEVGAGSGWNAALIGHLVGSAGHVYSLEIIPELARLSNDTVRACGTSNVHILAADGGDGYAAAAPYDRVIFTAGTYDLPRSFYRQIKPGGLLLIVIKTEGGGDSLFVMEQMGDHFESRHSMSCGFVQLTGKCRIDSLDPTVLEALPKWAELQSQEVARRPFWWGGSDPQWFMWQTAGIRSFLGITEPLFRAFKMPHVHPPGREEHYFGLWNADARSLALARNNQLTSYGSIAATERLLQDVHQWVSLGMPAAASFNLSVYPSDRQVHRGDKQWLVRRRDSQFLWSLEDR